MDGWTRAALRRHGAGHRTTMGATMGWLAAGMAAAGLLALIATDIRLGIASPQRAAAAGGTTSANQSSLYLNLGAREAVAAGWQ